MGLFKSTGRNHINGYKNLTKDAPIVTIENRVGDKFYYPTLTPSRSPITYIVKPGDKVLLGQKIGQRTDFNVPIYSSCSGSVLANEKIFAAANGMAIPHVVIESDGKDEHAENLKTVTLESTKEEIFDAIKNSGVVGMGGAGFPTYIKYQTTEKIDYVIANGVECEPYLTCDYVSIKNHIDDLIHGIKLLMKVVDAKQGVIAIKNDKKELKQIILKAIEKEDNISLKEVKNLYPAGWEKALVADVTKKTYEKLPAECGCIVNNVSTIIALNRVLTTGIPPIERIVTISGNAIAHPGNYSIRVGRLSNVLIETSGGYTTENVSLIPGGPMCSKAVSNDKFPITLTLGGITALKYREIKADACLRCGTCSANCPAHLQPVELKLAFESKNTDRMVALNALSCVECGTCSYVCPSKIDVTDFTKKCKTMVKMKIKK